ncbi:hypothetical protein [Anaplasma capra]|uniref:hypothetical protein n=1 Tax=Anaplasma capra TaxID=1562740 RepID=UPI0021D5C845|nr:hypothetical protein [Anaplasma capra]MCU7611485.1 hypothetical protein [Anaplasma capra]MCU7612076.1 hypothetical protein [Anaplasma capra]
MSRSRLRRVASISRLKLPGIMPNRDHTTINIYGKGKLDLRLGGDNRIAAADNAG